jgi:hypothetical protein
MTGRRNATRTPAGDPEPVPELVQELGADQSNLLPDRAHPGGRIGFAPNAKRWQPIG